MPLFRYFRPEATPIIGKVELWRGQTLTSINDTVLSFGFQPLKAGQVPGILTHFSDTFVQKIAGNIGLKMSFLLTYNSSSAFGDAGEIEMMIINATDVHATESFDFQVSDRGGEWKETNHLFAGMESVINNFFQIRVQKKQGSGALNVGLSEVRLFAEDLN